MNSDSPFLPNDRGVPATADTVLPIVSEQLGLRRVVEQTGAVRVRIESTEQPQTLVGRSVERTVDVQRVPVGEVVAGVREPWHEGDVLVVPVYEERLVLRRELVLKEQVRVRFDAVTRQQTFEATARTQRAVFERQAADGSWAAFEIDPSRHADGDAGGTSMP